MSITFGFQFASLQAQNALRSITESRAISAERLSSGLRINRASDDPAGLQLADKFRAEKLIHRQAVRNVSDSISAVTIATTALTELTNITQQIELLAQQAANGTTTAAQRSSLDAEAQELRTEYFRIVSTTEYNDLNFLNGSISNFGTQAANSQINTSILGVTAAIDTFVTTTTTSSVASIVGDGTFGSATDYGTNGRYAAIGDIDNDGNSDIMSVNQVTRDIIIKRGNGDGTFQAETSTSGVAFGYSLDVADLNNDNADDLIVFTVIGDTPSFEVFISNGDGTFQTGVTYSSRGSDVGYGTLGDFNEDGNLDVVYRDITSGDLLLALGDGSGSFGTSTTVITNPASTAYPLEIKNIDLDGDGNLDVVFASIGEGVFASFGNGNGTFSSATTLITNGGANAFSGISFGDIDNDGYLDIAVGADVDEEVTIAFGDGTQSFSTQVSFTVSGDLGGDAVHRRAFIDLTDLDGDGDLEILTNDYHNSSVEIYDNNGNRTFSFDQALSGMGLGNVLVEDFDGDGVGDIVASGDIVRIANTTTVATTITSTTQTSVVASGTFPEISLLTQNDATVSAAIIDGVQSSIANALGQLGAYESRLGVAQNLLEITAENFAAAESNIRNVDVAEEIAQFIQLGVREVAASAILAQINLNASIVLQLLNDDDE